MTHSYENPDWFPIFYNGKTMTFTYDWTSDRIETWMKHLKEFIDKPVRAMEIGSYEGRTSCWLLENILTHPQARFTSVDPYAYADRVEAINLQRAKRFATENFAPYGEKVSQVFEYSHLYLPTLPLNTFDLVYVDGQHTYNACLADMCTVYTLLAPDGIMFVDDIEIGPKETRFWKADSPAPAWKTFKNLGLRMEILWEEKTVGIRKTA